MENKRQRSHRDEQRTSSTGSKRRRGRLAKSEEDEKLGKILKRAIHDHRACWHRIDDDADQYVEARHLPAIRIIRSQKGNANLTAWEILLDLLDRVLTEFINELDAKSQDANDDARKKHLQEDAAFLYGYFQIGMPLKGFMDEFRCSQTTVFNKWKVPLQIALTKRVIEVLRNKRPIPPELFRQSEARRAN